MRPRSPAWSTCPAIRRWPISTARAEAVKNGYTNGVGGVAVTPVQDPHELAPPAGERQRPGRTRTSPASSASPRGTRRRDAKADFVLPGPDGQPAELLRRRARSKGTTGHEHGRPPTTSTAGTPASTWRRRSPAGTPWVGKHRGTLVAAVNSSNAAYDYTTTNNATQQFGGFGLNTGLPAGRVDQRQHHRPPGHADQRVGVGGVRHARRSAWPSRGTAARSVDDGHRPDRAPDDDHREHDVRVDDARRRFWTGHTTWTASDISNANFRVRLTGVKGCATAGTQIRLDQLQVRPGTRRTTRRVTTTTYTTNPDPTARNVNDPATGSLADLAGLLGRGASPRAGIAATATATARRTTAIATAPTPSTTRTGTTTPSRSAPAARSRSTTRPSVRPAATRRGGFVRHRRPLDRRGRHPGHDRLHALRHQQHAARHHRRHRGGHLRAAVRERDRGRLQRQLRPAGGLDRRRQRARTRTAAANPYHNQWWSMATGLAAGTYRLNVTTSDAGNNSTSAENMWSLWVSGGSQAARLRRRQDGRLQQPRGRHAAVLPGADRRRSTPARRWSSSSSTRATSAATARCASSARTGTPTTTPRSTTSPTTVGTGHRTSPRSRRPPAARATSTTPS